MKTVVGLFDNMMQAKQAANDLENMGIAHNDISLVANNESEQYVSNLAAEPDTRVTGHAVGHDAIVGAEIGGVAGLILGLTAFAIPGLGWIAGAGWLMGMIYGAGTGAVIGGLVGALTHVGVPEADAANYNEGVRRGGILIAVKAEDDAAMKVAQILSDDGAINIDERAAQYKQEGFMPSPTVPMTTPSVNAPSIPATTLTSPLNREDETILPVMEEELKVGKREVDRGGVRVYTHITETPVEEQVTLREEHINVERRPVNRSVTAEDNAFKEGSFEMTERDEEAVVSKQARVVEEVVVGKEASERTETVRDNVRRTDVEVEKIPGQFNIAAHTPRNAELGVVNAKDSAVGAVERTEGNIPGIQTGGHDLDGNPDTRGITEKIADTVTGDHIDDKTGKPV